MSTPLSSKKYKEVKLTKIEKALMFLAAEIEYLPMCDTRVKDGVLDILGYEKIPQNNP